jgi:hypothetical protein
MKKRGKILIGIIGSLVTLSLLAVGCSRLIDMEPVKERILAKLSQGLGGQVSSITFRSRGQSMAVLGVYMGLRTIKLFDEPSRGSIFELLL